MNFYYPNFQNDFWRIMGIVFHENPNFFINSGQKSFNELLIKAFCEENGIAFSDTAKSVIRQDNNASDSTLSIVEPMNIQKLLTEIPECTTVVTTGQKATTTLSEIFEIKEPQLCESICLNFKDRDFRWFRMPSTSRAYPKPLIEKANAYKKLFQMIDFKL